MFDQSWMKRWQDAVNANGPMSHLGKHLTTDLLLGFGDKHYVVSFRNGKVTDFTDTLGPETCYHLALRAPATSWEKFCQKVPPPMYNDIWAMAHPLHGRLQIEGDQKVLWQNMRAMFWAFDRMREI
jgi:hypothetical protein